MNTTNIVGPIVPDVKNTTNVISSKGIISTIIILLLLFGGLFLISWLVNKFILKKPKKNIIKVAIIIWLIIFFINLFSVIINIPIVIGINVNPSWDGGINGKYISLGYAINLSGDELIGESNYNVSFANIF